ncbi:amidase [Myxacorys almedinensis]|uniref:Amidase n=1 Tax=Myxacorys almedinensis A TaxID=2690445 RepID=A0A8J7Z9A9_9CYAN|nr:amidase [Myxacorys almedinensis]NDJ17805.1 amidase [Myxacorys almedinensis A]
MDSLDLAFSSALEQARLIREKQISPLELTQLYLDRIQQLNPHLGSFYTVTADLALQDARAKTEQVMHESELPPLFGVPIAIKDLNPVKGLPCSYGVSIIKKRVAEIDDLTYTKLRAAGGILLGKTATSQLGSFPYTEPPGFAPTRNPWDLDYTPGGSSGGSSSAVAAGLCAIAQGSDGGGSVRGPASCCGLVGLKPSRGRISQAPVGEYLAGCSTHGPLARTVADAAAFMDITAGYVTGDPYWLPNPEPSFLTMIRQPLRPLKIGVVTTIEPVGKADPECVAAVEKMAQLLEGLGHCVEPVISSDRTSVGSVHLGDMVEPFTILWRTQTDVGVPPFFLEKVNRWLWWRAKFTSAARYVRAMHQAQVFARRVVQLWEPLDVVLMPIFMAPVIRVGEWKRLSPAQTLEQIIQWIAPLPAFNVSGQPAISVPAGFDQRGLPIGVQLVGRPAEDGTILSLAAQIEQAQPWAHHRPKFATNPIEPG